MEVFLVCLCAVLHLFSVIILQPNEDDGQEEPEEDKKYTESLEKPLSDREKSIRDLDHVKFLKSQKVRNYFKKCILCSKLYIYLQLAIHLSIMLGIKIESKVKSHISIP